MKPLTSQDRQFVEHLPVLRDEFEQRPYVFVCVEDVRSIGESARELTRPIPTC